LDILSSDTIVSLQMGHKKNDFEGEFLWLLLLIKANVPVAEIALKLVPVNPW